MAIHADLNDFPLTDLLFFLSNRQSSGRVVMTTDERSVMLTIYDGSIVAIESSDPQQRLGQYLLRSGAVAEPALMVLLDMQRDQSEHVAFGELVVECGLADATTISRIVDNRVAAILAEILLREEGYVTFECADVQPRGIQPAGTTAQYIFDGLRLADENEPTQVPESSSSEQWQEVRVELTPFIEDAGLSVDWGHLGSDTLLRLPEPAEAK